jgi:hypothetical protein
MHADDPPFFFTTIEHSIADSAHRGPLRLAVRFQREGGRHCESRLHRVAGTNSVLSQTESPGRFWTGLGPDSRRNPSHDSESAHARQGRTGPDRTRPGSPMFAAGITAGCRFRVERARLTGRAGPVQNRPEQAEPGWIGTDRVGPCRAVPCRAGSVELDDVDNVLLGEDSDLPAGGVAREEGRREPLERRVKGINWFKGCSTW